ANGSLSANATTTPPGGSDTYVQFNNAGIFGGVNTFTFTSSTALLTVGSSSGGIVVGTTTALAKALLTIGTSSNILSFLSNGNTIGNFTNLVATSSPVVQIATTSVMAQPEGLFVSGRYAYVTNYSSNTISVVDFTNSRAPKQIATTTVESNPDSIYVAGQYAYVTNSNSASLSVIDISSPGAPKQLATSTTGGNGPESVVVAG